MLENLQTHRQLLFDLTANYLDPLETIFQRLAYLAGLRDASGKYVHERLAAAYGAARVEQVVGKCHEELFERLLEIPLSSQEDALRRCISAWPGSLVENVERCREVSRQWVPPKSPSYLIELYSSNLSALLELLLDNTNTVRLSK